MSFFVTGVPDAKDKIGELLNAFIQPPLTVDASQAERVTVCSPSGKRVEIKTGYKYVVIDYGFGGEMLEFKDHARNEKKYFQAILKFVLDIVSEESVSVEYRQWFARVDEIIPASELEEYRNRKEFRCVSWEGTFDTPAQTMAQGNP